VITSDEKDEALTTWNDDELPELATPLNSENLIRPQRLTMLTWTREVN